MLVVMGTNPDSKASFICLKKLYVITGDVTSFVLCICVLCMHYIQYSSICLYTAKIDLHYLSYVNCNHYNI